MLVWRSKLFARCKQRSSGRCLSVGEVRAMRMRTRSYRKLHTRARARPCVHVNVHGKHRDACRSPLRALACFVRVYRTPRARRRYFIHARIVRPGLLLFDQVPRTFRQLSYTCTARLIYHAHSPFPYALSHSFTSLSDCTAHVQLIWKRRVSWIKKLQARRRKRRGEIHGRVNFRRRETTRERGRGRAGLIH